MKCWEFSRDWISVVWIIKHWVIWLVNVYDHGRNNKCRLYGDCQIMSLSRWSPFKGNNKLISCHRKARIFMVIVLLSQGIAYERFISKFPVNKAESLLSFYSLEKTDMRKVPHVSSISFIFRKTEFRFFLSMFAIIINSG